MSKHFVIRTGITAMIAFIIMACNPAKNLNQQVHKRDGDGDGRETNIKYPQQPTKTPDNINMSYDFEQLFTPDQNKKIDSLVRVFEKSNLIAIKVTTLPTDKVSGGNFENNNQGLLKEWAGVHGNTDKAMVITLSKSLGKVAIDYGPFVDKLFSKEEASRIIDTIIKPALQNGTAFDGTWKGLDEIMNTIRKNIH